MYIHTHMTDHQVIVVSLRASKRLRTNRELKETVDREIG